MLLTNVVAIVTKRSLREVLGRWDDPPNPLCKAGGLGAAALGGFGSPLRRLPNPGPKPYLVDNWL